MTNQWLCDVIYNEMYEPSSRLLNKNHVGNKSKPYVRNRSVKNLCQANDVDLPSSFNWEM